jgi:pimeloyl-ACP methyl ester carboxylesterase
LDDAAVVDLRPELERLRTPTLLILGAADPALKAGLTDFALLPQATLDVMSGVGHVPPLERSSDFADTVRRFLFDGVITSATLLSRATAEPSTTATE